MATYGQAFNALGTLAARMSFIATQNIANVTKDEGAKKIAEQSKKMLEAAEKNQIEGIKREEAETVKIVEAEKKAKADKEAIQKRNRYFLFAGGAFALYLLIKK